MGRFSDSPDIDRVVTDLEAEFAAAAEAFTADPTPANRAALDDAATAFDNARSSASNAGPVATVAGDAFVSGDN